MAAGWFSSQQVDDGSALVGTWLIMTSMATLLAAASPSRPEGSRMPASMVERILLTGRHVLAACLAWLFPTAVK
jgi:hypothetical protein